MDKFQNKFRIQSARLQNWDYGWNAPYFVTICTANRELFFGDVMDDIMNLSEIGKIANKYWLEIPEHFPFVKLDVHVVMPNHVHGIVIIDKPDDGKNEKRITGQNDGNNVGANVGRNVERNVGRNVERNVGSNVGRNVERNVGSNVGRNVETPKLGVSTPQTPQTPQTPKQSQTAAASGKWKPATLGSIINQFKRICTIESRKINPDFAWQSRYHDHIIRNDTEYQRIKNYIINNPKKWNNDSSHH